VLYPFPKKTTIHVKLLRDLPRTGAPMSSPRIGSFSRNTVRLGEHGEITQLWPATRQCWRHVRSERRVSLMKNSFAHAAGAAAGIGIGSFGVHVSSMRRRSHPLYARGQHGERPRRFRDGIRASGAEKIQITGDGNLAGAAGRSLSTRSARRDWSFSSRGIGRSNVEVATFRLNTAPPAPSRNVWPFSHLRSRRRAAVTCDRESASSGQNRLLKKQDL